MISLNCDEIFKHFWTEDTFSKCLPIDIFCLADICKQLNPLDKPSPSISISVIWRIFLICVFYAHFKDVFPLEGKRKENQITLIDPRRNPHHIPLSLHLEFIRGRDVCLFFHRLSVLLFLQKMLDDYFLMAGNGIWRILTHKSQDSDKFETAFNVHGLTDFDRQHFLKFLTADNIVCSVLVVRQDLPNRVRIVIIELTQCVLLGKPQ